MSKEKIIDDNVLSEEKLRKFEKEADRRNKRLELISRIKNGDNEGEELVELRLLINNEKLEDLLEIKAEQPAENHELDIQIKMCEHSIRIDEARHMPIEYVIK